MSVGIIKPRDPRKLPEHTLWTLMKDTRTAEARVRMTAIGPELRFFVSRQDGELDLLWSLIYRDGEGGNLGDDAELKRREFLLRGWTQTSERSTLDLDATARSCGKCVDGWICETHPDQTWPHLDPYAAGTCAGPGMPCDCPIGVQLVADLDAKYR